ncbi:MAG: protein translocase subunit SecD [Desulfovibrio sp.]
MSSILRWKLILILVVLVLGAAYSLPSIPAVQKSALMKILPEDSISLGLDLKGGIHLTLGVDMDKAIENKAASIGQDIKTVAREDKIIVLKPEVVGVDKLKVNLLQATQQDAFESLMKDQFSAMTLESRTPSAEGQIEYLYSMTPEYRQAQEKLTIDQTVKTIRNRIDQFGVAEPDIRKQQGNRIQVQLPGLSDPERAINIIGKTAHLEFNIVDDTIDPAKGVLPPGRILAMMQNRKPDGTYFERPMVLKKDAVMTGEYITDANTRFDQFNQAYVSLTFNARGGKIFERVTGENVEKRLAIVLDGKVYSAPVIREKIAGGRASISGSFTPDEAHDLAIVLRAGALPTPVNILEQRTVGPSLGQESIDKGINSAIIGGALVLVFMIVYYGFAGVIADTVLAFNIILILAGLAGFGATLTLPGIAGIILTIGMAVDANVIIFERIREELRDGLTAKKAVEDGFGRATLTILDANITTIIAAIILYQFGTGPVRGFAVTLTLGILTSMFTAIFVSRALFEMHLANKPADAKLNI